MITIDDKIKSSKAILGEKINCSLEVLTPVHIGSGVKLAEGIDFTRTNQSVQIISQAELMRHLEDNTDERDAFINGNYKLNSLKRLPQGKTYTLNTGGLREILEFERNGNGTPYIPGSSIKGAFRTVLLKRMVDELNENEKTDLLKLVSSNKKEWASEPLMKKLFGENSNNNLMRVIEVFDAEFENVDLEKIYILTLRNQNSTTYGWKKMGRNIPSKDNPREATPIFVEALPIDSKGYFSISLSKFLFNNPTAQNELKFNETSLSDFLKLRGIINKYSYEKLNKEKEFFTKLNSYRKLNTVIAEIDKLIDIINKLNNDEIVLRISWGSGWEGMTGDYLDQNWLNTFRQKYRLGRQNFPFPKTRRIVFEDDEPKYLTGWIKIKLNADRISEQSKTNTTANNDPMELLKQKFKVSESKRQ